MQKIKLEKKSYKTLNLVFDLNFHQKKYIIKIFWKLKIEASLFSNFYFKFI